MCTSARPAGTSYTETPFMPTTCRTNLVPMASMGASQAGPCNRRSLASWSSTSPSAAAPVDPLDLGEQRLEPAEELARAHAGVENRLDVGPELGIEIIDVPVRVVVGQQSDFVCQRFSLAEFLEQAELLNCFDAILAVAISHPTA